MPAFNSTDGAFIGLVLESFFYGLYSGILAMFIYYQATKVDVDQTKKSIVYPLYVLYALSTFTFATDITITVIVDVSPHMFLSLLLVQSTMYGLCNFISQVILIYRCWIVWGCNIRVIIVPSFLTLAFLATWLAINGSTSIDQSGFETSMARWGSILSLTTIAISLAVNAIVTGLIMLRIFKIYWEVRFNLEDKLLGAAGHHQRRSVIFVIIGSGMAMFAIQLMRFMFTIFNPTALYLIVGANQIFIGISPSIILLRLSIGLPLHRETSTIDAAGLGSMRFESNPAAAIESVEIVDQVRRDPIGIEGLRSNNIQITVEDKDYIVVEQLGRDNLEVVEGRRVHIDIERVGSNDIRIVDK